MKKSLWRVMATGALALILPLASWSKSVTITEKALLDKIKGGWAGQMIGVTVGGPTEFRAQSEFYTKPIEWNPEKVKDAIGQDDLYVEMTFTKVMDEEGLDAEPVAYGRAFADSQYHLWHANFYGRMLLRNGIMPPQSGHPEFNPHADDIDFQIEAEFIGLMCPGLPATSNKYCDIVGHVMNYGDGVYGGVFVDAMYATAFFEKNIEKIVQAGIASLPKESEYGQSMMDVYNWYKENPNDWKATWQKFEDKWANTDICPDGTNSKFDIDAKTNGAYIAIGLLYGKSDFKETVNISTMCGQDSDCNPASAAGILGVIMGYNNLPKEWTSKIEELGNEKFAYTDYSFNDICESTLERARKLIEGMGGSVEGDIISFMTEEPVPAPLEQWKQDQVSGVVGLKDAALVWKGEWKEDDGNLSSTEKGASVTLNFEGTGAMIKGEFSPEAGVVKIYLDDKHMRDFNLYYDKDDFRRESIYHVMGLEPGKHSIRLEVASPQDKKVSINGGMLFNGPEKGKQQL